MNMVTHFHWLTSKRSTTAPVTFGIPFAHRTFSRAEMITIKSYDGKKYPIQTVPMAYWPDGSVKWLKASAVLPTNQNYMTELGTGPSSDVPVHGEQALDGSVTISSGELFCHIPGSGGTLFDSLHLLGGINMPVTGELAAYIETVESDGESEIKRTVRFSGRTETVILEESGPIRAVVRLDGIHQTVGGARRFPFTIRLYFYAGSNEVKFVHSFMFDANENTEFLKGIAIELGMKASGELYNRHVGFSGESGMFYEGVKGLYACRRAPSSDADAKRQAVYKRQQIDGQLVLDLPESDSGFCENIEDNASYDHFLLHQDSCDHYCVRKRTKANCASITALQGNRSSGAAFFGSRSGAIAVSVRDFWQKSPMALEIVGCTGDTPVMTIWLASKYAQSMDFRAYDTVNHPISSVEMYNDPKGIANTNEIWVKLFDNMPGKGHIYDFARDCQEETLLVSNPETYEETSVFGKYWINGKGKSRVPIYDRMMEEYMVLYLREVEQRKWYGFWDYGDIMHSYDYIRHCWKYDVGGYAWNNTELLPTYASWIMFLRTGNYEYYRFARAFSRHSSEIDSYHGGLFDMLGSRHSVRHWGCTKEARISMAGHYRFFYYLTGDERIGDVMDHMKDADIAAMSFDPMRNYYSTHTGYAHIRTGPDWVAFTSNWMTRWERFEDTKYRDKLLRGLKCIEDMDFGLLAGPVFHYDANTGILHDTTDPKTVGHTHPGVANYSYHMVAAFGGPEIWFELADLLEDDRLRDMLAQFGRFYSLTPEEKLQETDGLFTAETARMFENYGLLTRLFAYAGWRLNDKRSMDIAWDCLRRHIEARPSSQYNADGSINSILVEGLDCPRIFTETAFFDSQGNAQWILNYAETCYLDSLTAFGEEDQK